MMQDSPVALAVFAHPDDDELSCFGTLARLSDEGYRVFVLEMTAGESSNSAYKSIRTSESQAAAGLAGISVLLEALPDGYLKYDVRTIAVIEKHFSMLQPRIVVTHYPQTLGMGHQDHESLSSAVVNVARRTASVDWILYAEPPTQGGEFSPNFYVDITRYMDAKKEAVRLHQSEAQKSYMNLGIIEVRASWWALQVHPQEYGKGRYYEAFRIVKGVQHANGSGASYLFQ